MKRISIVGTVGLPANYGGFETFVSHLAMHVDKTRYSLTVFCSSRRYTQKLQEYQGVRLRYVPLDANGSQSILYDVISLIWALWISDVVLVLGVSGTAFLPLLRIFTNKRIIVHVDGMEWKRAKWNRLVELFLKVSESLACKYADNIVADNDEIRRYIAKEYGIGASMIAYGGDHVIREGLDYPWNKSLGYAPREYFFTVCRIEPENNVHLLLGAFAKIGKPYVLVGNWAGSAYGRSLRKKYAAYAHIHMLDPIYDQKKLDSLRARAFAYVHGHSAGGTNPSLVEAMCHGLPILAFDASYNRATTHNQALFFHDEFSLMNCLTLLTESEAEKLGRDAFEVAQKCYTWRTIAAQYQRLFELA